MSVDSIVNSLLKEVPKAVAAGVVDMDSGMLIAVKTVDSHPQQVLDLLAAATKDLFEGDNVMTIENVFKRARGVKSDERYFREIIVSSTNLLHFFSRLKSRQSIVLTVVCRMDANLGLVVTKARDITNRETI
ncbi:MAG: hypothetical protein JNM06_06575 [Blastocatellia bacterium]|nr:hypothetical protein [Blastocatellia bacterium]MBN8722386.1 hypothetical protein [Acidobacteriota bacterium]